MASKRAGALPGVPSGSEPLFERLEETRLGFDPSRLESRPRGDAPPPFTECSLARLGSARLGSSWLVVYHHVRPASRPRGGAALARSKMLIALARTGPGDTAGKESSIDLSAQQCWSRARSSGANARPVSRLAPCRLSRPRGDNTSGVTYVGALRGSARQSGRCLYIDAYVRSEYALRLICQMQNIWPRLVRIAPVVP